jgi:small subunit ribosomal protein S18
MDCYFCKNNIEEIDFRETALLKRFISALAKIRPKQKTGLCAKHQRELARNIKRARQMGLMPYLPK